MSKIIREVTRLVATIAETSKRPQGLLIFTVCAIAMIAVVALAYKIMTG